MGGAFCIACPRTLKAGGHVPPPPPVSAAHGSSMKTVFLQFSPNLEIRITTFFHCSDELPAEEINVSVEAACSHFKDDLDHRKLLQALENLPVLMNRKPATTLRDIITKLVELGAAKRLYARLVRMGWREGGGERIRGEEREDRSRQYAIT